jgi:hypothetical protein
MTSKEKRKGTYHENWWVALFKSWRWASTRQPLSGILKEFPNDIRLFAPDNREEPKYNNKRIELICESKYRAKGFALITKYLKPDTEVDLLLLKEKSGSAYVCFNVKNEKIKKVLGIETL